MITFVILTLLFSMGILLCIGMYIIDGWNCLRYHEGSPKRFLQHFGIIKKDASYAAHMLNVYLPNRKRLLELKDIKKIIDITSEELFDSLQRESDYVRFDNCCEVLGNSEITKIAIDTIKQLGFTEAKPSCPSGPCFYDVNIMIGPRNNS